jgi:addiction module HigA family antidote
VTPRKNAHPGEILARQFMAPAELSANALARELGVPPNRISSIINGSRGLTADTAHRLARYFKTTPEFWMDLKNNYELAQARAESAQEYANIKPGPKIVEAAE